MLSSRRKASSLARCARRRGPRLTALILAAPLALACGGDVSKPEPVPDEQLFWSIGLNHEAVLLSTTAPYNTLPLTVTARNVRGEPMAGAPAPRYLTRDAERVVVVDGELRAVAAGSEPVWVVASLTWGDLTYADSVAVRVVDEPAPPVLTDFSIHPLPPDSAKVAENGAPTQLPVRATDADGAPIASVVTSFRSSDATIAEVDRLTGVVRGLIRGAVTITASTTAFGVTKSDTLPYRVGLPVVQFIELMHIPSRGGALEFTPAEVTIGVGAMVGMRVEAPDAGAVEVVFNEAAAPALKPANTTTLFDSATMAVLCTQLFTGCADDSRTFVMPPLPLPPDQYPAIVIRLFSAPGVYDYYNPALGTGGRVIVVDDR